MKRVHIVVSIALTLAAVAASLALYPQLPETLPIHWNFQGEPDGYGPKALAAFLMPGVMALMLGLMLWLPRLSPKRFEVDEFRGTYSLLVVMVTALFGYIHAVVLWAGLGEGDVGRALLAGLMLFFAAMGNYMGKVRRNFWMGVRTPWTLADERVWNQTHRLAAWSFVAAGLAGFALALAGAPVPWVLGLLLAAVLVPVVYSLVAYKRFQRRGEL